MPIEVFTAGQASRLSGLPYQQLSYWAKSGFLLPSIAQGSGPGSRRLYSFEDLIALGVVRKLRGAGVSLQAIRKVIDHLKGRGVADPLASVYLVTDGNEVYERQGKTQLFSLLRTPGQGVFTFVDLGTVETEIRHRLACLIEPMNGESTKRKILLNMAFQSTTGRIDRSSF